MARIAGVEIPEHKQLWVALTVIYGIGRSRSLTILSQAGIDPRTQAKTLTAEQVAVLRNIIEKQHAVEGELRRRVRTNIKRLKEINSYRGIRHAKGLPVRGQQTRTNNRTVRGNLRRTTASGRKPPPSPT